MLSKKSGQLRDAAFGGCYGSRQFDVALRRRGRPMGRRVGCLAGTADNRDSTGSNNRHADWGDAPGVGRTRASVVRHGRRERVRRSSRPRKTETGFRGHAKSHVVALRLKPDLMGTGVAGADSRPHEDNAEEDCRGIRRGRKPPVPRDSRRKTAAPEKASGRCARMCGSGVVMTPDRPVPLSSLKSGGGRPSGRLPFSYVRPMRRTLPAIT